MAHITLSGALLDPAGEFAVGDQVRFTHKSTTGDTVEGSINTLIIPPDGSYSVDIEYGLVMVEYKDAIRTQFINRGIATVNQDNPATSIPELLNALVPVSSEELIEFQAILADCVAAADRAEAAAATLDLINDLSQTYEPWKTVAEMQADATILPVGKKVFWRGYYTELDGGGNWGVVKSGAHTADGGHIFTLADGKYIEASLKGKPISIKFFGAKGDYNTTTQQGTDDTEAIKLAIDYAYSRSNAEGASNEWHYGTPEIYVPSGVYRVTKPSYIFTPTRRFTAFYMRGDGMRSSRIVLDSTEQLPFIDTGSLSALGFSTFEGLYFQSINTSKDFFRNYHGQGYKFTRCSFEGWNRIVSFLGTLLTSEFTMLDCQIKQSGVTGGSLFYFDNEQCLNIRIVNTDIESFSGDLFYYVKGAAVCVYQGSIIPSGNQGDAAIVKIDPTASASFSAENNNPLVVFNGSRFEMREQVGINTKLIENQNLRFYHNVAFKGCGMGGTNLDGSKYTVDVQGNGDITFDNCSGLQKHRVKHMTNASFDSGGSISYISCRLDPTFYKESSFTLTGGTQQVGYMPTIIARGCKGLPDGAYQPLGGYAKPNQISPDFYTSAGIINTGVTGTVRELVTPTGTLWKVEFNLTDNPFHGAGSIRINCTKGDGSHIFDETFNIAGANNTTIYPNVPVAYTDMPLKFTFSSDDIAGAIYTTGSIMLSYH